MRYSANSNITITALDMIRFNLERDFNEISKLQNNPRSLSKFVVSSYNKSKSEILKKIDEYLPDINIELIGEESKKINKSSNLTYIINPIDGLINFSRSIALFSSHISVRDQKTNQIISHALLNGATGELFFADKTKGAFLDNSKIRVSKNREIINCALSDNNLYHKSKAKIKIITNCPSLDIAYFAAGRIDEVIFDKKYMSNLEGSILLAKESGAIIKKQADFMHLSNGL